jgi:hypothetical protein
LHITWHKNKSSGKYYCGNFDCCYKEPNCPKKNKHTCTFSATFCRFGTKFKFTKFNLEHNHALILNTAGSMIGPGGLVMKTNAAEITAEECNLIKDFCTNIDMYNLESLLKTNFQGVDYSNELLHNVV